MRPELQGRELVFEGNAPQPSTVRLTYAAKAASTDEIADLLRNVAADSLRDWQDLQVAGLSLADGKLVIELGSTRG